MNGYVKLVSIPTRSGLVIHTGIHQFQTRTKSTNLEMLSISPEQRWDWVNHWWALMHRELFAIMPIELVLEEQACLGHQCSEGEEWLFLPKRIEVSNCIPWPSVMLAREVTRNHNWQWLRLISCWVQYPLSQKCSIRNWLCSHFGSKEGSLVTISQPFSKGYCHVCVSQDFVQRIAQIENGFVRTSPCKPTSIWRDL